MAELHETMMGNKFYSHDVPRIANALERIAEALEKQNLDYNKTKDGRNNTKLS